MAKPTAAAAEPVTARLPAWRYDPASFEQAPDWIKGSGGFLSVLKPTERQAGDDDLDSPVVLRFHGTARAARPGDWVVKRPDAILVLSPDEAASYGLPSS
jgi:hypothetical protein